MNRNFRLLLASLLLCLLSAQATATIVRLDAVIGSQAPQAINIELFDLDAPATVANFLNYVDNEAGERRYDGTFVHRLATGFVVQLGGYTFDPTSGNFEDSGRSPCHKRVFCGSIKSPRDNCDGEAPWRPGQRHVRMVFQPG